jgi:mannosyltransferase
MDDAREHRIRLAIVAALTVAALAIYSIGLGKYSLGASEAYSAWAAAHPSARAIVEIPILDDPGKNVLYYIALHYFTAAAGTSEAAIRGMSAMFAVIAIPIIFGAAREMFDESAGVAAAAMWAFNPLAVVFARRARMYAMFIALALGHLWAIWRARKAGGIVAASLAGVLGAAILYTHMAGAFIIAAEIAMLSRDFMRGRRTLWAWIAIAIALAIFAPYLPIAIEQSRALVTGHTLDWIGTHYEFAVVEKIAACIAAGAIGAWFVLGRGPSDRPEANRSEATRWLLGWIVLPATALALGSIVKRPMFNLRYLAPATAAASIFASAAASAWSIKLRNLCAAGFALASLIVLPFDFESGQPWREFAIEVKSSGSARPVFFESGYVSSAAANSSTNNGFPQGYYSIPFTHYFQGPNPIIVIPSYDPALARTTISGKVREGGGGWLVSWKDEEVASELPDAAEFAVKREHHEDSLAIYRIEPRNPGPKL